MKRKGNEFDFIDFWEIDNDNILEMKMTSVGCPVQFEGKLKDGTYFYFRERHDWTRFAIAKTQKEAYRVRDNEALYFVSLPDRHHPSTASDEISNWVDDYFKRKQEKKELLGEK